MAITKAAGENTLRKLIDLIKSTFFRKDEGQATGTIDIDSVPTDGSTNLVTSGGVKAYVDANSGGGGTSDYTDLTNKPKIGGVELNGNKSASDLGLYTSAEATQLTEGIATTFMSYNQQNEETFATKEKTGDNDNLVTTKKGTLVDAINEVVAFANDVNSFTTDNANAIVNIKNDLAYNYYDKDEVDNLIVSTINASF